VGVPFRTHPRKQGEIKMNIGDRRQIEEQLNNIPEIGKLQTMIDIIGHGNTHIGIAPISTACWIPEKNTILFPPISGSEEDDKLKKMKALSIHEASHKRFTTLNLPQMATEIIIEIITEIPGISLAGITKKRVMMLINALEDSRIEKLIIKEYPKAQDILFENRAEVPAEWKSSWIAAMWVMASYGVNEEFADKIPVTKFAAEFLKKYKDIIINIISQRNQEDSIKILKDNIQMVIDLFKLEEQDKKEREKKEKQKDNAEKKAEKEKQEQEKSEQRKKEDNKNKEKNNNGQGENDGQGEQDGKAKQEQQAKADKKQKEDEERQKRQDKSNAENKRQAEQNQQEYLLNKQIEDLRTVSNDESYREYAELNSQIQQDKNKSTRMTYNQLENSIAIKLAKVLVNIFQGLKKSKRRNQLKGKLDCKKLYKATMKRPNVFMTAGQAIPKTDIVLLIDSSGSTQGNIFAREKTVAKAFNLAVCKVKNIRLAIEHFANDSTLVKRFDSRILRLPRIASGGTEFAYAINSANELLKNSTAKKKLIIMLTDGEANENGLKRAKYPLMGIGIGIDIRNMKKFGEGKYVAVQRPEDLPAAIITVIRRVVSEGRAN